MKLSPWSLLVGASVVLGCGDHASPDRSAAPSRVATEVPAAAIDAGVTALPAYDPASGFHLDPDVGDAPRPAGPRGARDRKIVQLLLRSTPPGAMAAVDGVRVGPTPVLWEGLAAGDPREFTFVLPGHALARYQFVPITDGIVHGTLARIPDDERTPELPATTIAPPARTVPRPPPPPTPAVAPTVDAAGPTEAVPLIDGGAPAPGTPPA